MLDFFLQNNIKSALKKQLRSPKVFLNFNLIKRVLILFDGSNWQEVKPIIDDLLKNGKNVLLWTVVKSLTAEAQYTQQEVEKYSIRIVNLQKDLKWTRTLNANVLDEYENLNYDTFLDLSFEDIPLMLFLKALNKSQFSIGLQEKPYKIYNFILLKEEEKGLLETYEQIKFYLTTNA